MRTKRKKSLVRNETVIQKIFLIRGHRIILDKNLAELYGVTTRALNQAVKRNRKRFPKDFMFSLTREEIMRMSQSVTSLKFSKSVHAFTEQGIAMLSSVLNSERAIAVNIAIMRTFVKLRKIIAGNKRLAQKLIELEQKVGKHDEAIQDIILAIQKLIQPPEKPRRQIGFHP